MAVTGETEFDYQWKNLPSKKLEYNQDRIGELLLLTKLEPDFFKGKRCLDVGCGSGRYTYALQELGADVTSFDISREAIKRCKEINPESYVFDLLELVPNPVYDFVLCWGVLHHLPDPREGFTKIVTQVKPGGTLYIMVYHKDTQKWYIKSREKWQTLSPEQRAQASELLVWKRGGDQHSWWDAFNPKYNWGFHHNEIKRWFKEGGFKEIVMTKKRNINMRGVKI